MASSLKWLTQCLWTIDFHIIASLGHQIDQRVLDFVMDYVLISAEMLTPPR
jgi:hypothetical protein